MVMKIDSVIIYRSTMTPQISCIIIGTFHVLTVQIKNLIAFSHCICNMPMLQWKNAIWTNDHLHGFEQSGNALCPWAVDTNIDRQIGFTKEIADMVNCTTTDNQALVECMKNVEINDLLMAQVTVSNTCRTGLYLSYGYHDLWEIAKQQSLLGLSNMVDYYTYFFRAYDMVSIWDNGIWDRLYHYY